MASASVVDWASTGSTMTSLELYTASTWPGGSREQRGTPAEGLEAVEGVSEGAWGLQWGELGSGWGASVTLCGGQWARRGGAPVVEGTAHHGVLAGLQHHVTVDKLLDSSLAVGQQAAQAQAATAAEGGSENQDAQVQEVAVSRVRAPTARPRRGHGQHLPSVALWPHPAPFPQISQIRLPTPTSALVPPTLSPTDHSLPHLLPSWKRANSRDARSSTVSAVTPTGPLAELGKQPCTRTSCQSECTLQMSTESKYLSSERTAH